MDLTALFPQWRGLRIILACPEADQSAFADVPGGPLWVISHIGCGDDEYTTILLPAKY